MPRKRLKGTPVAPRLKGKKESDTTRQGPLADEMIRELQTELYLVDRAIAALMKLYALRLGHEQEERGGRRT
jgi:hypothetical protein